ncbi:MAG: DUF692 domain-containing protein [Alphaproteobacteria bacterium]
MTPSTIPAAAGVGLRHVHLEAFAQTAPAVSWVEVHSENFFGDGGAPLRLLDRVRRNHPVSLHGVGLSLGSAERPDPGHLRKVAAVAERYQPGLVSEHAAWAGSGGVYLNDLLPLPYTEEALDVLCRNIAIAQDALGRPLLMENPSTYLRFAESTIPEWEFMAELPRRTGCGLLLDVNNIVVSCLNHGYDAAAYLDAIDPATVGEIHIAGHSTLEIDGAALRIDDHASAPPTAVWDLLDRALRRCGPVPVLLEWDQAIPPLQRLVDEAAGAQAAIDRLARAATREVRHVA